MQGFGPNQGSVKRSITPVPKTAAVCPNRAKLVDKILERQEIREHVENYVKKAARTKK